MRFLLLNPLCFAMLMSFVATREVSWEPATYRVRRHYDLREGHGTIRWHDLLEALGLGVNGDLITNDAVKTAQGTTVLRFTERHKQEQIKDSQIDVSLKADGTVDRIGGRLTKGFEESLEKDHKTNCHVKKRQAINLAFAHEGIKPNQATIEHSTLTRNYLVDDGESYRTVSMDITWSTPTNPGLTRKFFTIDSCTREVTAVEIHQPQFYDPTIESNTQETSYKFTENGKDSSQSDDNVPKTSTNGVRGEPCETYVGGIGGNEKTNRTFYGFKPFCLEPIRIENGTCYLENRLIKVYNIDHHLTTDIMSVIQFPCADGVADEYNGGYSAALDTFFHATVTVRMFSDWYGFTPFQKIQPRALVHFGTNVDNAFWDGQALVVGDGGRETFPYSSLDTVAHEMSHGITEHSSGLRFQGQSGAVNDAFSDIAGETSEVYLTGHNDWIVGAEIVKAKGKGIRYFSNPDRDGVSISHLDQYKKDMEVHRASGIFNKAFYVLAQTIGIRKTFQAFLTANRIYWREQVHFDEAACNVVKAAYDSGLAMEIFHNAFRDVGIQFASCADFTEFILPLTINEMRDNLIVSMTSNPLFRLDPLDSEATTIEVSVDGGLNTRLYITSSYDRDETFILSEGVQTITFELDLNQTTFLRIGSEDSEDTDVSVTISFS